MTVPPPPVAEPAHAFLAPSAAHRWGPGGCPASPSFEAQYPEDQESPEAIEGTAGHHVVSEALSGRTVSIGDIAPNGHPINRDMIDAGEDFIRDVLDTVSAHQGCGVLRIEHKVSMRTLVHELNWGTPDAFFLDRVNRILFIWDYKYGHRYVDAYENWQCVDYSIGIFHLEGVPPEEWHLYRVVITIAQPRNYHPDGPLREWRFDGAKLLTYRAALREAALKATAPNPAMVTGEHCRDCNARHACPALQRVAMWLVDLSREGQPFELPTAALGLELLIIENAIKRLKARATGLEEDALARARRGENIPHWAAEYSKGRTRWTIDAGAVICLGQNFGIDLAKPTSLTPLQSIKAGIPADLVGQLSETPSGAMTLVPFDDSKIAKRFS